jgi:hypothetical protein
LSELENWKGALNGVASEIELLQGGILDWQDQVDALAENFMTVFGSSNDTSSRDIIMMSFNEPKRHCQDVIKTLGYTATEIRNFANGK